MNLRWHQLPSCTLLGLLLVVCLPLPSQAQCAGLTAAPIPFAKEVLLINGTAKPLTPSIYKPSGKVAVLALVTVEGGDIRYTVTGNPTSSDGHYVASVPPQTFQICGIDSIAAFQAIRVSTDAVLTVTYYRVKSP